MGSFLIYGNGRLIMSLSAGPGLGLTLEEKIVFGPFVHSLRRLLHASCVVFVRRIRVVIGKDRKHKHIHDILDVASISSEVNDIRYSQDKCHNQHQKQIFEVIWRLIATPEAGILL